MNVSKIMKSRSSGRNI